MRTYEGVTVVEVTRRTGMTRKALRLYEESGLVRPTARTPAGYRLYDEKALRRLELMRRAKVLGLHLREMPEFLEVAEGCCNRSQPELVALVRDKLAETDQRLADLNDLHATLQDTLERLVRQANPDREPSCNELLCTCQIDSHQQSERRNHMSIDTNGSVDVEAKPADCDCGCSCCSTDGTKKSDKAAAVAAPAPEGACNCGCGS